MSDDSPDEPNPASTWYELHCSICGHVRTCSPEQVREYSTTAWPKCCEETMRLSVERVSPSDLA